MGRSTIAWTTSGRVSAAAAPRARGSIGTRRHVAIVEPLAREGLRDDRPCPRRPAAAAGQEQDGDAGPPSAGARRRMPSRTAASSGNAIPAPSLDSPSAPNAPR